MTDRERSTLTNSNIFLMAALPSKSLMYVLMWWGASGLEALHQLNIQIFSPLLLISMVLHSIIFHPRAGLCFMKKKWQRYLRLYS